MQRDELWQCPKALQLLDLLCDHQCSSCTHSHTHCSRSTSSWRSKSLGQTSAGQTSAQVDRHEELLRSCLRAVDALSRLPGSEASAPFTGFLKRTVMSGLRDKFLAAQAERQEAEGEAMEL